jgi:hypothetical protein
VPSFDLLTDEQAAEVIPGMSSLLNAKLNPEK